ncbi:Uncharacterized protein ALO90_04644 [Pseudomonas amygdali pv. aesculi]|nr:Uncharacterized protein ALO90_04644 [Pseudomonas amygdali pv. aesculi]
MKTTHLQHHPSLGYLAADSLHKLPVGLLLPHECSGFVSFRAHPFRKPERVIKNLHAALRPLSMYDSGSYCFYGVQSDSPLAPLLLWDGAHFLNVGEKITVIEDTEFECYLDREYFAGSLKVIERSATSVTYKKVARLAAESDDDLDGWSFCLPVGPGDATVLNAGQHLAKVDQRCIDINQRHRIFQAHDQRTQFGNLFTEHHIDDVIAGGGHVQRCPQRVRRK